MKKEKEHVEGQKLRATERDSYSNILHGTVSPERYEHIKEKVQAGNRQRNHHEDTQTVPGK